jgi:hypothetical protein
VEKGNIPVCVHDGTVNGVSLKPDFSKSKTHPTFVAKILKPVSKGKLRNLSAAT